jgi:cyclopropane-fatty-acyl-phospholipid synthase
MATQQEMEATYNYMAEIFRLSLGETGDRRVEFHTGFRMLEIGCRWGPMLKAAEERRGHGVGLPLSTKQAEACRHNGLEAHVRDWKDISVGT